MAGGWTPDGRAAPTGERALRVDLAGLSDLARVVRADTDVTLRPESARVRTALAPGVCFGAHSASGYVYAAKQRYRDSLVRATALLSQYLRATDILAAAAERVATEYAHADALAAAQMSDVERALAEATEAARAARPRHGVAPA